MITLRITSKIAGNLCLNGLPTHPLSYDNPLQTVLDTHFFTVQFSPYSNQHTYFSRCYAFTYDQDLQCDNDEIVITNYGLQQFELNLCPLPFEEYTLPYAVSQLSYTWQTTHTATLLESGTHHFVLVESSNYLYQIKLPFESHSPKLSILAAGHNVLVISCQTEILPYHIIIDFSDDYYELWKGYAATITMENHLICIEKQYLDTLGHGNREMYSLTNNQLRLERTEPIQTKPTRNLSPKLLPYLLLESVNARCLQEMTGYLAPDLATSASQLIQFFGEFDTISQNPFTGACCTLKILGNRKIARSYTFEIVNAHIQNIELCESE